MEIPRPMRDRIPFEIVVVLFVVVLPMSLASMRALLEGNPGAADVRQISWSAVSRSLHAFGSLLLLGFLARSRREQFSRFGLAWNIRVLPSAIALLVSAVLVYAVGHAIVQLLSHSVAGAQWGSAPNERTAAVHWWILATMVPLLAFFEESVCRGYLMTRMISDLRLGRPFAVLVSAMTQFSYHTYYGWARALESLPVFVLFSLWFSCQRNLVVVALAHAAINYVSFCVSP